MKLGRFFELTKQANAANGLDLLPKLDKIEPISSLAKPPKPPEIPNIPKPKELKLDTGLGKSKPAFTHDFKVNSPYNQK